MLRVNPHNPWVGNRAAIGFGAGLIASCLFAWGVYHYGIARCYEDVESHWRRRLNSEGTFTIDLEEGKLVIVGRSMLGQAVIDPVLTRYDGKENVLAHLRARKVEVRHLPEENAVRLNLHGLTIHSYEKNGGSQRLWAELVTITLQMAK